MEKSFRYWPFYVLISLLICAFSVQLYAVKRYPYSSTLAGRTLTGLLPELPGWKHVDLPIAQSEAAVGNVEKILRYDDVAFRRYQRGPLTADVYVAHWQPGKMSYWDVGAHNPDSCWIYNGFSCSERLYGVERPDSDLPLKPFEFGSYALEHTKIDVIFWHLVGGKPNRYEKQPPGWRSGFAGRIERLPLMLKDIRTYGLDMHREQYFIRISTNQPMRPLFDDPDFRALLQGLRPLGILREDQASHSASDHHRG